ncbi:MAG: DUF4838 domain-containing protein [Fuerstiella sp.]|nr:DUF4838 domain-containing protein [Fuerstiella sp.]
MTGLLNFVSFRRVIFLLSVVLPSVGSASDAPGNFSLTLQHSPNSDTVVEFAVSELKHYLERVYPVSITIQERENLQPWELCLHLSDLREPNVEIPNLPPHLQPIKPCHLEVPGIDAFMWKTGNGVLTLVATRGRSLLYGVYDVLEKAADCGFYTLDPGDEVVPVRPAKKLKVWLTTRKQSFEQAAFSFRGRWYTNEGAGEGRNEKVSIERLEREADWFAKCRDNVFIFDNWSYVRHEELWKEIRRQVVPELLKRGIIIGVGGHETYRMFLPPDRYGIKHPEWYALKNGKRLAGFRNPQTDTGYQSFCTTNPQAMSAFLNNFEMFLNENPEVQVFNPMPRDGLEGWCDCPECGTHTVAKRYLDLNSALAERARRVRPGMRIMHIAYATTVDPDPIARPTAAIDVDFAPWGRNFAFPFRDPQTNRYKFGKYTYQEACDKWLEICRDTGAGMVFHEKYMRFRYLGLRLMPLPNLVQDVQYLRELGVDGFEQHQEMEGWWTKSYNKFVVPRVTWNPDVSVEQLERDYFRRYWGKTAQEIRDIYKRVTAALPELLYGSGGGSATQSAWTPDEPLSQERRMTYLRDKDHAISELQECLEELNELKAKVSEERQLLRRIDYLQTALDGSVLTLQLTRALVALDEQRSRANAQNGVARKATIRQAQQILEEAETVRDRFHAACQEEERTREGLLWCGYTAWRITIDEALAEWQAEVKKLDESGSTE